MELTKVLETLDGIDKKIDTRFDKVGADYKKQFDDMATKCLNLEADLKTMEGKLSEAVKSKLAVSVPGVDEGKEKFSFQRSIAAMINNDWSSAPYEQEVLNQTQKRAVQQGSTDALGGFLIPIQVSSEFIDTLRTDLIMSTLGVRILNNLPPGIYEFIKKVSNLEAMNKSETGRSQRTSMAFSNARISPKIISAYCPMSERIMRTSVPAIEGMVREDLRLAVMERMESQFFFGSGGDNEPLGLCNNVSILGGRKTGVTAGDRSYFYSSDDQANGHALSFEDMIQLEGELADRNALPRSGGLKLATNHGVSRLLRTEKYRTYDSGAESEAEKRELPMRTGLPLTEAQIDGITGVGIKHSNIIPITGANQGVYTATYDSPTSGTKKLAQGVFGNFGEVIVGMYQGMAMRASRDASDIIGNNNFQSAFTQNQVWIKIDMEFDVAVRHEEGLVVLNNLRTRRG